MIHPNTEIRFIDDVIGYGVVATKLIPQGTITWVQDSLDTKFSPNDIAKLSPITQKLLSTFSFTNGEGLKILCWDNAKYVNHSFRPSCFTTAYDFEIAIRDIEPGEQLTDDYGYLNIEEPFTPIDEGTDRKVVFPDDLLQFHHEWDQMLHRILPFVFENTQPLLPYIPDSVWSEFRKLEYNPLAMRSLLTCYFDRNKYPKIYDTQNHRL